MRYKCLIIDHDDTVVNSTKTVHYPSFLRCLDELRPGTNIDQSTFSDLCFEPGFISLCTEIMGFTPEELEREYEIWREDIINLQPQFFDGMADVLKEYRASGGIICVASHSHRDVILRDYQTFCGFAPDLIFGCELPGEQRKPCPYPVESTRREFDLENKEIFILDDLKTGLDMARVCSVDFGGAGWAHFTQKITHYMQKNSDYYFKSVDEFGAFILD